MSLALTADLRAVPIDYKAANEQLQQLAGRLQARLRGRFSWWYFGDEPVINANYQGFTCRVFGMNQPWRGRTNTSLSCIVELPQRIPFRLRVQNVQQVSTNFFVSLQSVPVEPRSSMPDVALQRVLPDNLLQALQTLKLPFELVVNHDRITFTAFSLYEHDFYLRVLDTLTEMARQLLETE